MSWLTRPKPVPTLGHVPLTSTDAERHASVKILAPPDHFA